MPDLQTQQLCNWMVSPAQPGVLAPEGAWLGINFTALEVVNWTPGEEDGLHAWNITIVHMGSSKSQQTPLNNFISANTNIPKQRAISELSQDLSL